MTAFTRCVSRELGDHGICVNTLAPGRIETERILQIDADAAQRTGRSREEVTRDSLQTIPLRRYGRPEEFGAAAAFLASEQAAYITGVTLLVDGGLFRGTY